eukprot:GABV01000396.1.p1 GENE.GABV01000396.1~~GABV01000396.1.p1  ORF type:complete len:205 (-),score=57.79 GABV01000396.1:8-622(-)
MPLLTNGHNHHNHHQQQQQQHHPQVRPIAPTTNAFASPPADWTPHTQTPSPPSPFSFPPFPPHPSSPPPSSTGDGVPRRRFLASTSPSWTPDGGFSHQPRMTSSNGLFSGKDVIEVFLPQGIAGGFAAGLMLGPVGLLDAGGRGPLMNGDGRGRGKRSTTVAAGAGETPLSPSSNAAMSPMCRVDLGDELLEDLLPRGLFEEAN